MEYVDTRAKVAQYSVALSKIVKLFLLLSVSFRKLTRAKTLTACDGCFCEILLLTFLFLCGCYVTHRYNQNNLFCSVHGRIPLEKEGKCMGYRELNLGQYFSLRKLASAHALEGNLRQRRTVHIPISFLLSLIAQLVYVLRGKH